MNCLQIYLEEFNYVFFGFSLSLTIIWLKPIFSFYIENGLKPHSNSICIHSCVGTGRDLSLQEDAELLCYIEIGMVLWRGRGNLTIREICVICLIRDSYNCCRIILLNNHRITNPIYPQFDIANVELLKEQSD